jgi:hypothetical protein
MTSLQQIRNNIDDHVQIGFANEQGVGTHQVLQLNARNIWDIIVKDSNEEVVSADDYEIFPMSGQLSGTFPEGDLTIEYKHAAFTDEELEFYLEKNGSVNAACLNCIEILLSSAAKRFDYKAGIKDIKASQVFDNLKELRETYANKIVEEENLSANAGIFITRKHPAYDINLTDTNPDVSRSDS